MRTAGTVTTTTLFSLNRFRQNFMEIIGTFESYVKGQQSNLARRATQGYAVQLRRAIRSAATGSCAVLRKATLSNPELH